MTEHVHEWRIDAYRDDDNELTIGVFCWHKGCNEQRSRSEAEAMLNATERLSAEDLFPEGFAIVHPNLDKLIAYANILEGKDD